MGVTNRDASILTKKNRGVAENAYYQQWYNATVVNGQVGVAGPAKTSAEVVAEIRVGCTECATLDAVGRDPNASQYPFNPSSGGAGRRF
uniref:Uncharacterized protein n=1 Tax=viral metagenome TaxID=1070528 RepID=A0A6C0L8Z0_9ZZZZ